MRALVITNMYPTHAVPNAGPFVAAQVESVRAAGVEVDVLHLDRTEGRNVYWRLGRKVKQLVPELDPDLVHVMYGGVMADTVTRVVRDHPVLVSFCGTDLLAGTGNGGMQRIGLRYGALASRRAARRAAGIVVKSRNLLAALPAGLDDARIWIVPNGVDLDRFRPLDRAACQRQLGWDPERRHVLFPAPPGRPEKRHPLAKASVELANERGLAADLHVLERIPHEDVPIWLNAANAILLTSEHEGSPNAVKEALACDVAVVSVDVGDVRERIEAIDGCFLADATPQDLADKLSRALRTEGRIDGRRHVADLSLDQTARRVRDIYALLARGSADTPTEG